MVIISALERRVLYVQVIVVGSDTVDASGVEVLTGANQEGISFVDVQLKNASPHSQLNV